MKKENNILIIEFEGKDKINKIDLNTLTIYGVKNTPINRLSYPISLIKDPNEEGLKMYKEVLQRCSKGTKALKMLQIYDKISAVGLNVNHVNDLQDIVDCNYEIKLSKKMIQFFQENYGGIIRIRTLKYYEGLEKIDAKYYGLFQFIDLERLEYMEKTFNKDLDFFLELAHKFYIREKLNKAIGNYETRNLMMKYVQLVTLLNKPLIIPKNPLRDIILLEIEKESKDSELFQIQVEKAKKLGLEQVLRNGQYQTIVPNSAEDVIKEGREQNHCVGGYVDNIKQGETFIVLLRKTEQLEKSYITLEVNPFSLKVVQYRKRNNEYPNDYELEIIKEYAKMIKGQ